MKRTRYKQIIESLVCVTSLSGRPVKNSGGEGMPGGGGGVDRDVHDGMHVRGAFNSKRSFPGNKSAETSPELCRIQVRVELTPAPPLATHPLSPCLKVIFMCVLYLGNINMTDPGKYINITRKVIHVFPARSKSYFPNRSCSSQDILPNSAEIGSANITGNYKRGLAVRFVVSRPPPEKEYRSNLCPFLFVQPDESGRTTFIQTKTF